MSSAVLRSPSGPLERTSNSTLPTSDRLALTTIRCPHGSSAASPAVCALQSNPSEPPTAFKRASVSRSARTDQVSPTLPSNAAFPRLSSAAWIEATHEYAGATRSLFHTLRPCTTPTTTIIAVTAATTSVRRFLVPLIVLFMGEPSTLPPATATLADRSQGRPVRTFPPFLAISCHTRGHAVRPPCHSRCP